MTALVTINLVARIPQLRCVFPVTVHENKEFIMLNFISGIWFLLSIILTGLGLVSVIQSLWDIDVISYPELILKSYQIFRDKLFYYVVEWWAPFRVQEGVRDLILIYLFCSTTIYNYYKWIGKRALDDYGRLRLMLMGPLYLIWGIYDALDNKQRKLNPQYALFYFGHIVATVLFASVAVFFFLWNYFLIKNL